MSVLPSVVFRSVGILFDTCHDLRHLRVVFGARVIAEDEDGNKMQCRILSDIEADGKMVISCTSPVGRALIGRCVGDTCVVRLPSGEREYEILDIKFKE